MNAASQVHPESALPSQASGLKYDGGKIRYSLLPAGAVAEVVQVLEFGARKYAPDNWKHVPDARTRYYDASMRHIDAWWNGERLDAETNLPHLAHAVCCLLFLMWFDTQRQLAVSAVHSDAKTTTHFGESAYNCASDTEHEWVLQNGTNDIFCRRCLAPYEKP
jgi:hypothetical protein